MAGKNQQIDAAHRSKRSDRRRSRKRIAILGTIALVLGVLALAAGVLWVGNRALIAKNALQSAQGQLTTFKSALGQPNAPSTVILYKELQKNTGKAAREVDDPVWSFAEGVPVVGPNLKAFRQVAQMLNTLVVNGVQPVAYAADGISVDSLKPKNGALDIEPLKKLTPAITSLDIALRAADASAMHIDTSQTVSQITAPVAKLHTTIAKVLPITSELRKVMPLFYPALGGNGARHYLLMFQNNAEERASGGNPAALAMLDVDHGKIKLGKQPNSNDFPHPYAEPPLTFKGDWNKLYGTNTSTYETNITETPDFPTVARLARAMWRKQFGGTVDGVISFDPGALAYLMEATGPIKLQTGETLTSQNAVSYLLSGVYAKYPDPTMQNAVFASAAKAIFDAVSSGQGLPKDYLKELTPMLADQRLKAWSNRANEEAALMTSPAGNMLPADNTKATTVGVYYNDDATSKMSYYMNSTVTVKPDLCTPATPTYSVSTKVTDTLKPSQIAGLSAYVLANQKRIVPGGDRQWVQIYGPVGAKLTSAYVDGTKVVWGTNIKWQLNTNYNATGVDDSRPAVHGDIYGRPVAIVSINMGPLQSATVTAHFSGGTTPSATMAVSHTPKVNPVPVTITPATCK